MLEARLRQWTAPLAGSLAGCAIVAVAAILAIANTPGSVGDATADVVLGQPDFTHNAARTSGLSLFAPAAVTTDSSGHLYVADDGNNRILGWKAVAGFMANAPADIVVGQPDSVSNSCATTQSGLCFTSCIEPRNCDQLLGSIAVDQTGNLYIADGLNNRVLEFDSPFASGMAAGQPANAVFGQDGSFTSAVCTGGFDQQRRKPLGAATADGLCSATGVAIDSAGNLYVADSGNNRVLEYNTPLTKTGIASSGDTVADLVFGQNLSLTTNSCNDGVGQTDVMGLGPDSLCGPEALAFDHIGNLYVSDSLNNRILEYKAPTANPSSPKTTAAVVIGQAGFVSRTCNAGVSSGDVKGIGPDSLCNPEGLAFDAAGNLYVADRGNSRVLEYGIPLSNGQTANVVFGQSGNFTASVCDNQSNGAATANGLCAPAGLGLDDAGNLFVADTDDNALLEYDTPLAKTGIPGSGDTTADLIVQSFIGPVGLSSPAAAAIDLQGHLYVADSANNRVLGWENAAVLVNGESPDIVIGQPNTSTSACAGGFNAAGMPLPASAPGLCSPMGVAVDSVGNLYVADSLNNRVLEYDSPFDAGANAGLPANLVFGQAGDFTATLCAGGVNPSTGTMNPVSASGLCDPSGVAVDAADNLYVADTANSRVLEYHTPLIKTAVPGSGDTIADLVFGQDGNFKKIGCDHSNGIGDANGVGPDSLCVPLGVAVDPTGNLYVADQADSRVLEYHTPLLTTSVPGSGDTIADLVLGQLGSFSTTQCDAGSGEVAGKQNLCAPQTVAADSAGNLYVADTGNNRVLEFNPPAVKTQNNAIANKVFGQGGLFSGNVCNVQLPGGPPGPSADGLCAASGVAVDSSGNAYVADTQNNRLLKYNAPLATLISPTPTPAPTVTVMPTPSPAPTAIPTPIPPGGRLSLGPGVVKFGNLGTDKIATLPLRIKNAGNGTLAGNVDTAALAPPFSLVSGAGPFSLAHNQVKPVTIQFAPKSADSFVSAISIVTGNSVGPVPIAVTGSGVSGSIAAAKSLRFGKVPLGKSKTLALTIRNTGLGVLHGNVGALSSPWSVRSGGGHFALTDGNRLTVRVRFAPTAKGRAKATLTIDSDDVAHPAVSVRVSGTGK